MRRVSRDATWTLLGSICECRGTSRMSSYVSTSVSPAITCAAAPSFSLIDPPSFLHYPSTSARQHGPLGPMALLVFLPTAAITRVVAANLRLITPHRLDLRIVSSGACGDWRSTGTHR